MDQSPGAIEGAANVLALNNGQTLPAVYRSITRYVDRCAHLGCTLPAPQLTGYCCQTHRNFANANAVTNCSFHYFGCFLDSKHRDTVCCICLFNRLRGFHVGIPVLPHTDVFQILPWEQPNIFSTDWGECNWLFFRSEIPATYRQIPATGGLKWKSNPKKRLIITGVKPQDEQRDVFITSFNLRSASAVDNPLAEQARNWNLHLYECEGFFLYCLSVTTDVVTANPKVVTANKNKRGRDEEEDLDEAPSSSKKSGKRPKKDNSSHVDLKLTELNESRAKLLNRIQNLKQIIWEEIWGSSNSRDKMLLELEQECLGLYNKKVEESRKYRVELQRLIADAEAEIASLMSALGEQVVYQPHVSSLPSVKAYDALKKGSLSLELGSRGGEKTEGPEDQQNEADCDTPLQAYYRKKKQGKRPLTEEVDQDLNDVEKVLVNIEELD